MGLSKLLPDIKTIKQQYIQKPYDTIVDVYYKKHFDDKDLDKYIDQFSSLLPLGAKVLDIGCGPGGETKKLIISGLNATGIDISNKMIDIAQQVVPDGTFKNMDLMKLDFPNNYFDGIWSARTLIHIPSKYLAKSIAGIKLILKLNGIACFIVLKGKGEGIESECPDLTGKTSCFVKYFHKRELDKILKKQGFKILQSDSFTMGEENEHYLAIIAKKR